ncbi:DUF1343 domain-containing protein [Oleiharenicola lentus]|uniref:DUF1343 domain-containing protein n=1 Tax=Oleiharenicola lentus TaxID=2508720 RepID=UPI003F669704
MSRRPFVKFSFATLAVAAFTLLLGCANKSTPAATAQVAQRPATPAAKAPAPALAKPTAPASALALPPAPPARVFPVMLGIDVLEAEGFRAIAGKKIALLTHRAGVNRLGESTINVLRRAPNAKLVALFAPEHGIDGEIKAAVNFGDYRHAPTGLPIYSLYGKNKKPTAATLKGIDAVVIDLQDVGVRSYTFISWMRHALEGCFENGVEAIVLDRPNPLGGWKVDGPLLDTEWMSDVGAFPNMPYVHGLTIAELARMAKFSTSAKSGISDKIRAKGKLTVIPMRGWNRSMQWPETGLRWVQTSPLIPSFEAAVGYAMLGLGTQNNPWRVGKEFPYRSIGYPQKKPDDIIRALEAYKIPGVNFVKRPVKDSAGSIVTYVVVEVSDWAKWNPTELSFYMQKQAAIWSLNPFATLKGADIRTFNVHVGSTAWFNALRREGARIDVPLFVNNWKARSLAYQAQTKRYWMYQ